MRALRLAAAFLAVLLSPQAWLSAGAASSSNFSLVCGRANAGSDVPCTITRLSGGKGIYVLFRTSDATAKAGIDYTAVSKLFYLKGGQLAASAVVHTVVNPAATGTLTFNAAIAASSTDVANAQGAIIEPAPPPPVTQSCPDGSIIPASSTCPVVVPPPPPASGWVSAPLASGGYARCKTVGGCHGFAAPYPAIIANQGDVLMYAWVGISAGTGGLEQRQIGGFWPRDQYKVAGVGVEGFSDEWEGVVAAVPAPMTVGRLAMREGLTYRVVGSQPAPWLTGGGTIYAVQYASDTTGHYYLADDPVVKQEIQYFYGSDLQPVP